MSRQYDVKICNMEINCNLRDKKHVVICSARISTSSESDLTKLIIQGSQVAEF